MEIEKGKTFKYLRDKKGVSQEAKEKLKEYNAIKKTILDALKEEDLTIPQLAKKITDIPQHKLVFYLMSMVKYGIVQTGDIDDMDEYFYYKLKK